MGEKEFLTAISICAGIITLIDTDGTICKFRQRGINNLSEQQKKDLVALGFLERYWYRYDEIPKHISLVYEDAAILGQASIKYPTEKVITRVFQQDKKSLFSEGEQE